ncbi:MAG: hypothetical protein QFX34_03510 [Candidatus Verstraetearchaeota archaeon]|nr:hypothetical protein [Candidatus Verstraetearchaeota archaeon]
MRILVADFIILNMIALMVSFLGSLAGWNFLNTFVLTIFLLSGIVLIFGGYLGFFVSSIAYSKLFAYLRLKREGKDEEQKKENKEKPEKRGLRMVVLGVLLFTESLALTLFMI